MKPLEVPLQIGGHNYKTIYDSTIAITEGRQGQHSANAAEIRIFESMEEPGRTTTWLHEMMEAVNEVYCNGELEHRHIEQIAQALYQILPQLGAEIEWK
ncbi:MAG: hypothetical protein WC356_04565 [Candidatus Micrarchaeia archaeon]|jgi:hypothetical protein